LFSLSVVSSSYIVKRELPQIADVVEVEYDFLVTDVLIPRGGSLYSELLKNGLTGNQIAEIVQVFGYNVDFRSIQPNDHFQVVRRPETNEIVGFNYLPDLVTTHKLFRNPETNDFDYTLIEKPITRRYFIVEGLVYTTLDRALIDNNVDDAVRHAVTNALSSRINFAVHTKRGDTFKVFYEERYFEDIKLPRLSRLFYMAYSGSSTGFHEGFRYTEEDEKSIYNGFYTPTGISMLTSNFRWPLDRIHVSSPFGNRIHPVLRTRQFHAGVDYRATTGTPVYAVSSGRVIMAGWNGGYGNTVEIRHDNGFVTQYAHLSRISVRNGQSVARGSVIGAVGSTGLSTGPHLHFGLRINGRWSNPSNIRMVAATKLEGKRLEDFQKQIPVIRANLARVEDEALSPFEMTPMERYRRVNARVASYNRG
jgi:murein DD-endopeptidase MepM/ murein hydrolase activator NlpD